MYISMKPNKQKNLGMSKTVQILILTYFPIQQYNTSAEEVLC